MLGTLVLTLALWPQFAAFYSVLLSILANYFATSTVKVRPVQLTPSANRMTLQEPEPAAHSNHTVLTQF